MYKLALLDHVGDRICVVNVSSTKSGVQSRNQTKLGYQILFVVGSGMGLGMFSMTPISWNPSAISLMTVVKQ